MQVLLYALLGLVVLLIPAVIAVGLLQRKRKGSSTTNTSASSFNWRFGPQSFWSSLGKMELGVVILLWAVWMVAGLLDIFPNMFTFWGIFGQMLFYTLIVAIIAMTQPGAYANKIAFRLAIIAAIVLGTGETVHMLFSCDNNCQLRKQEAARQETLKQERLTAARIRAIEAASKPASTAECPGATPTKPILITTDWYPLQHECDATWVVLDAYGKTLPANVVATEPSYGIPKKIRMKEGSGQLFIMFCPPGTRLPPEKGWTCKPRGTLGEVRQAGIDLGVRIGGYYR